MARGSAKFADRTRPQRESLDHCASALVGQRLEAAVEVDWSVKHLLECAAALSDGQVSA